MKEKVWRCDCGGSHFVAITKLFDDTPILSVELYETHRTLPERIRGAWTALRGKDREIDEVLLNDQTAREIVSTINDLLTGQSN